MFRLASAREGGVRAWPQVLPVACAGRTGSWTGSAYCQYLLQRARAVAPVGAARPLLIALGVALIVLALVAPTAQAATGLSPVVSRGSNGATADGLPTVQIDGVVWTQKIVGNTVYAGGQFSTARPAGAAPGTQTVARSNLLAFDIRTGQLIESFAPSVNGVVRALAASPDNKTLYVGGTFTKVNGVERLRFAAIDLNGGTLRTMAPQFNGHVRAIVSAGATVFVGGAFTQVGTAKRSRLASFTSAGQLRPWSPAADGTVLALTLTPDRRSVVAGGSFTKIGSTRACGMTRLDPLLGRVQPWLINTVVKNCGSASSIMSLTTDGTRVYGSGYSYGGGNYEGVFAATGTGRLVWLQDCRGDTYDVAVANGRVYSVGHAHNCGNVGGFPEQTPRANYNALAATTEATGEVGTSPGGYVAFQGKPSPSLVNWFPRLAAGSFTGQNQAAWSIVASGPYLVLGGEFVDVNGVPQQGLVRFTTAANGAPLKVGPTGVSAGSKPTLVARQDQSVDVSYATSWDRDDQELSYAVLRDGTVVHQETVTSRFWERRTLSFRDTGLTPGRQYTYRIRVRDPDGNTATSASTTVDLPAAPAPAADERRPSTDEQAPTRSLD